MRNKKIYKIEVLERRITNLEDSNKRLCEVVEFLTKNDKHDVTIEIDLALGEYVVEYLLEQRMCRVRTKIKFIGNCLKVLDYALHKVTFEQKSIWGDTKYYVLNQKNETFAEIPKPAFVLEQELAEKEAVAKKEKASENRKRTKGSEQAK